MKISHNRLTVEKIESFLIPYNYKLIKVDYVNQCCKITYKDEYGYFYYCGLSSLKRFGKSRKFDISNPYTIYNIHHWLKQNYPSLILVDNTYKNIKTRLCFKDLDGYLLSISLDNLMRGKTPTKFGNGNPYTIKNYKTTI